MCQIDRENSEKSWEREEKPQNFRVRLKVKDPKPPKKSGNRGGRGQQFSVTRFRLTSRKRAEEGGLKNCGRKTA